MYGDGFDVRIPLARFHPKEERRQEEEVGEQCDHNRHGRELAHARIGIERGEREDREPGRQDNRGSDDRATHGRERVPHRVVRCQPALATGAEVFAQEVHSVVHHNAERHRRDDRQGHVHPSHDERPHAEGRDGRNQVRDEGQRPEPGAPECDHQQARHEQERKRRTLEHALDVPLRDVGEHDRRPHALGVHRRRRILF